MLENIKFHLNRRDPSSFANKIFLDYKKYFVKFVSIHFFCSCCGNLMFRAFTRNMRRCDFSSRYNQFPVYHPNSIMIKTNRECQYILGKSVTRTGLSDNRINWSRGCRGNKISPTFTCPSISLYVPLRPSAGNFTQWIKAVPNQIPCRRK